MEHIDRNLQQVISNEKLDEPTILLFLYQISLGIQFLQNNHLAHRDLKSGFNF